KDNPRDPKLLDTRWKLLLAAHRNREAIAAGEALARVDTSAVTPDFFRREIGAAQADSDAQAVMQLAARAAHKFPKDFLMVYAQQLRKAGQLQEALVAAQRAAELEPTSANAWLYVINLQSELNRPDSAMLWAQKAMAAGVDKMQIGQ